MRRIFTSPRLENVERVAALLREEGVEARITNGRSYKGGTRSRFTYRDDARSDPDPAVWIVRSEDQPKARELMRAAGLLDSGRSPTSYLSTAALHDPRAGDAAKRRIFLVKMGLLVGIVVAAGVGLLAWRTPAPSTAAAGSTASPATAVPASDAVVGTLDDIYLADVPSALASMLLDAELQAHDTAEVCLFVDGAAPSDSVLAQLQTADRTRLRSGPACEAAAKGANTVSVDVREYRTDGSGTGTVRVEISDAGKDGQDRVQTRTLEVSREELRWEVKRVVL